MNDQYISLDASAGSNITLAERIGGPVERASVEYISFRNNHVLRPWDYHETMTTAAFDVGYGINVSKYLWNRFEETFGIGTHNEHQTTISAGLSIITQCRFGDYFRIGFRYQPGIINTGAVLKPHYQDYFGIECIWKIML